MDADGTKNGYDLPMTRAVADAVEIPVVASGGAGEPEHLRAALTEGGASAALAASIFHYREFTIAETKDYLARHGVPVRPSAATAAAVPDAATRPSTRDPDDHRRRHRRIDRICTQECEPMATVTEATDRGRRRASPRPTSCSGW